MGSFAVVVVVLTFLANLSIGLVVYRNNPKSWTNRFTAGLALIFAFWTIFNYFALLPGSEITRTFWVRVVMLVTTPMGAFTYLLAKCYPNEKLTTNKITNLLLISLALIVSFFALSPWMFGQVENLPNGSFNLVPGPAIFLFAISHLGLTTWGLLILINKFRHTTGLLKKQFLFLVIGTILTLTLITLTNFVAVVFFNAMQYTFIGPTFTLFQVGFITYAILKHRLFDIRLLVTRTVSYTILLLFISSIVVISLLFTAQFFTQGTNNLTVYTIITLFIAFSFNPLKNLFEKATKNIFYKEPYNSDDLLEKLGEIMRSTLSIHTLTENVLHTLTGTLKISQAAFLLKDNDKHLIKTVGYPPNWQPTPNTVHNLIKTAGRNLVIFDDLEESTQKMLLRDAQVSVIVPLKVKDTTHGLLLLGEKASGEIYSQQDIDVIEIIMPQIAIAIQNAQSYEAIRRFNLTLKKEIENATHELRSANSHLKHLDKLKNDFIFVATHELKNPVTAMRGYVSMLLEGMFGQLPEKLKDPLNQLQASTQQLVDLVNDLLQIARSEAKTLNIQTEAVNICQTTQVTVQAIKVLADQKHLTLIHSCPPENSQIKVQADPQRLKEVLNNLLSNAIKYSETGTISINSVVQDKMVITQVKDQGVGISPEDQKKLFTKFFRVEEEAAKGIPGTGLGLYIIKEFIEKMGGKIWLESQKGVGTTIFFSLPRA